MKRLPAILAGLLLLLTACSDSGQQSTIETTDVATGVSVVASNYPLFYFANRIAEGVESAPEIVLPEIDGDPAFWIPGPEQVQLLQTADLVLLNGAGAESWLSLVTIDHLRLHDTSSDISRQLIPLEESVQHQHGPEGEHSHQGTAFTTWLDPQLAIAQAESITEALIALDPSGETQFRANMETLRNDLEDLDRQLAQAIQQLGDWPVIFSHPVYQYLQRRYEINGTSVHWEPDEEPSTPDWVSLQQLLAGHPAEIMIWEDQPLEQTSEMLADAGIASVAYHPAANRPDSGDFISVMKDNASRIAELR